jgi:hypothetical protein
MNSIKHTNTHKAIQRAEELYQKRKQILKLSPEQAMEKILEYKQPDALVHSFVEQDFYFLIHEIGPEDCLPLLALASQNQWEYLLDMEMWNQDRIGMRNMTRWLYLLFNADPKRMIQWFLSEKTEIIEFYLHKFLNIIMRNHDEDPSDFGDGYFTLDDTFYIRIVDLDEDSEPDPINKELKHRFLNQFLEKLADFDFIQYQKVLLETIHVLPAETEEESYRLRTVRLAEKGFLPFSEAVGVYQPMTPEEIKNKLIQCSRGIKGQEDIILYRIRSPISSSELADDQENVFSRSLKSETVNDILPLVQSEFASLCNQLISADRMTVQSRDQLKDVVRKACGYLSIGMENLSESKQKMSSSQMAAIIAKYPLTWIFRAGYGRVLMLKWRIQRWQKSSWYHSQGLALAFWDEFNMGVLGGLMIKNPLFFDNYKTGILYREFESSADVEITADVVEKIMAMDQLLSLIKIDDLSFASERLLTYKNMLLTLWARNFLGMSEILAPIPIKKFTSFYQKLFDRGQILKNDACPKVRTEMKTTFINWLLQKAGLTHHEISKDLEQILEELFMEIENEYAMVAQEDLDPRFVNLFLLEQTNGI